MTWQYDCGAYRVYIIEDGYYWRDPVGYYEKATDHDWRLHPRNEQGQVRMNFGCYLVTDGDQTIMVDSGIGDVPLGPPGMVAGLMPEVVDSLGIARETVATVVYTHMHYDHVGGSQRGGRVVFDEARHVFHRQEWSHWQHLDTDLARAAQNMVRPLIDEERADFVDGDVEVLPGVVAFSTPGHTPGHLSVSVESSGHRVIIGGDMSNHPFQVEHPEWSLPVDVDPVLSGATRQKVFADVSRDGAVFMAGHYPMPGVGTIEPTVNGLSLRPFDVPKALGGDTLFS